MNDMRTSVLRAIGVMLLCTPLISVAATAGQEPAPVSSAPVPSAIRHAVYIFVSNAGADSGLFPHPFSGSQDRGYNQFYAALQATRKYKLVSDIRQADLVLELRLTAPNGPQNADKQKGASDPLPMFRLVVYDTGTHYVLWALTEDVNEAALQKTHDRNFDDALNALVLDFETLSGKAPATTPTAP